LKKARKIALRPNSEEVRAEGNESLPNIEKEYERRFGRDENTQE
jgi:hypothetical protein